MKNKKGFTLAEILGVIVIIGVLLLLITPSVLNRLGSKKESISESTERLIFHATGQYINEHRQDFKTGITYCIKVDTLIKDGKLVSPVKDVTTKKTYDDASVQSTILSGNNIEYKLIGSNDSCATDPVIKINDPICGANGSSKVYVEVGAGAGFITKINDTNFTGTNVSYENNIAVTNETKITVSAENSVGGKATKTKTFKTIQLKFDTNGGNKINPISKPKGLTYGSLPTPIREGYHFDKWYEDKELTKPVTKDTCLNVEDGVKEKTLFLVLIILVHEKTLHFD